MVKILWSSVSICMYCVFFIHIFVGGYYYVRPLLIDTRLAVPIRIGGYFCFHLVTLDLFALGTGFFVVGIWPKTRILGICLVILCLLSGLLNLGLAFKYRLFPFRLPQWVLFFIGAVLGGAAWLMGHA